MISTALIVAIAATQAAEPPPAGTPEVAAPPAATAPAAAAPAEPTAPAAAPAEPTAPVAATEAAAEVRQSRPAAPQRRLRWGLGAATMPGQSGAGGSMEVGADFTWWGDLGLRGSVGLELAQVWGSFWIAPELAWRMGGGDDGFGPYLGGGLMLAAVSIADPNAPLSHGALGWRADAAGSAPGGDGLVSGAGIALNPFKLSAGPTASAGFALRAGRTVAVDLGVRYGLLFLESAQSQVSLTLAVNGAL